MEPGLAAAHPEIKTYAGRGIDDPAATVRADIDAARLPRSVRSPGARGTSTPTTTSTTASTSATTAATWSTTARRVRRARAPRARPTRSTSARSPTPRRGRASRCARTGWRSSPTRRTRPTSAAGERHRGQGHADQPRQPDLRGRDRDPAGADRRQRQAQPQHGRATRPAPTARAAPRRATRRRRLTGCAGGTLTRNRIVIGQIIGASNYDIGHIVLGVNGGGVASLGVVGGNGKAQGCTGLPTPVGDFFAVDYVAHEMGHQFAGNHTFNGTQRNCSGGNRNAGDVGRAGQRLVDHGLRRHLPAGQPAAAQRPVLVAAQLRRDHGATSPSSRPADQRGPERLAARLRRHGDSFTLELRRRRRPARSCAAPTTRSPASGGDPGGQRGPDRLADRLRRRRRLVHAQLQGRRHGADRPRPEQHPAGHPNALQGGNEQQQVTLTGFNAATQSFQIQIGGNTSAVLGAGGLAISNAQRRGRGQRDPGLRRHRRRRPAPATAASR